MFLYKMPKSEIAKFMGEIVKGVFHFAIDDGINYRRDCYAIVQKDKTVLIDPLPIGDKLNKFPPVKAIFLTASCHQRFAWKYRHLLKVPVYVPKGGDFKEKPDHWLKDNQKLPGGIIAIHAPGPTDAHYAFYSKGGGGVIFCADLLTNIDNDLEFVESEYQDEPAETRESVRHLLDFNFKTLCFNHGNPITHGAKKAILKVLKEDEEFK